MFVFLITVIFIIWCLFFTKQHGIGKFLYELSNFIDIKMASLISVKLSKSDENFSYLTNHNASKPPLLLLHGFSADNKIWLKFAQQASKDYHLYIPDLMGHGDIPFSEAQNYSAYEQANYVRRFLAVVNITEPVNIVGNSMGGMIAAILAKSDTVHSEPNPQIKAGKPLLINKLILLNPAGAKSEHAIQRKIHDHNPFAHENIEASLAFFANVMHKPPFVPPAVKHYLAQVNYIARKEPLAHMLADFFNPDTFFDTPFSTSAKQIVLIWGKEDLLLPVSDAAYWEFLLGIKACVLNDIGHMPMVECPQQTYSLIH